MTPEQKEFLVQAETDMLERIQIIRNNSNDHLENGANYAFVLCNAKINFISSIITDISWALSGNAPTVVVESIILAVQHVEENFSQFLGTCESTKKVCK
jgi:hypothetical protein